VQSAGPLGSSTIRLATVASLGLTKAPRKFTASVWHCGLPVMPELKSLCANAGFPSVHGFIRAANSRKSMRLSRRGAPSKQRKLPSWQRVWGRWLSTATKSRARQPSLSWSIFGECLLAAEGRFRELPRRLSAPTITGGAQRLPLAVTFPRAFQPCPKSPVDKRVLTLRQALLRSKHL